MLAEEDGLVRRLVAEVPALQGVWAEHLSDNYGEVLPHVLLAEITRYAINAALGTPEDLATARRIVSFLERNFEGGSARIKELVAVSFLENLPRDDQQGHEVWELLGPELAAEAARLA